MHKASAAIMIDADLFTIPPNGAIGPLYSPVGTDGQRVTRYFHCVTVNESEPLSLTGEARLPPFHTLPMPVPYSRFDGKVGDTLPRIGFHAAMRLGFR